MGAGLTVPQQLQALAIVTKPASVLSFLGSLYIVQDVLKRRRRRGGGAGSQVQARILLGLSMCDMVGSVSTFLSTWPIPESSEPQVYGAMGNDAFCTFSGTLLQFSAIGSPFYNGSLSLYYLLSLRFGWTERDFAGSVLERFMHFVPLSLAIVTSLLGIALDGYHNAVLWCWWAPPFPYSNAFRMGLVYGPLWVIIAFTMYVMATISYHVFRQEKTMTRYASSINSSRHMTLRSSAPTNASANSNNNVNVDTATTNAAAWENFKKTRMVATQGIFYSCVFILTYFFATYFRLAQMIQPGYSNLPITITAAFFLSLQGYSNFLVYVRPSIVRKFWGKQGGRRGGRSTAADSGCQPFMAVEDPPMRTPRISEESVTPEPRTMDSLPRKIESGLSQIRENEVPS